MRREVWTRDDGRCGFVGEDGHRCNETRGVQFGHIDPWGKGGADTAINLGLRCITHNAWEADRDYGTSHMASKRTREPLKVREPVARYGVRRHALRHDRRDCTIEFPPLGQPNHHPAPALDSCACLTRTRHRTALEAESHDPQWVARQPLGVVV